MSSGRIEIGAPSSLGRRLVALGRSRRGRAAAGIASLLALALVALEVISRGSEVGNALGLVSRAAPAWIAAALGLELGSYLLYASAQRRLLRRPSGNLNVRWLASLGVSAQALNNFLPAGYVAANLLNFRALGRRGLAPATAGCLLLTTSALYIGSLAVLTVVSGVIAGGRGSAALGGVTIGGCAVLVALIAVFVGLRLVASTGVIPERWLRPFRAAAAPPRALAAAGALFLMCWLADAGCLLAAMAAIGVPPSWTLIPLAYCAAQLLSFVPITPGGVGLVEGGLAMVLMSAGGSDARVLAAVLLYRLISYWGTLPVGLLSYLTVVRSRTGRSPSLSQDVRRGGPASGDRAIGGDRPLVLLEG